MRNVFLNVGSIAGFILAGSVASVAFGQGQSAPASTGDFSVQANQALGQGDAIGALLWTAFALRDHPTDIMLRYRAGNLIRQVPLLIESLRHDQAVNTINFSPDGKTLVTASDDDAAQIWEVTNGQPMTPPLRHAAAVTSARYSPDGSKIVTASVDNTARVWAVATGQPLSPPLEHSGAVTDAAFSPDGQMVVTSSQDKAARVWNATMARFYMRASVPTAKPSLLPARIIARGCGTRLLASPLPPR
jgi:WD40 repeat protein